LAIGSIISSLIFVAMVLTGIFEMLGEAVMPFVVGMMAGFIAGMAVTGCVICNCVEKEKITSS